MSRLLQARRHLAWPIWNIGHTMRPLDKAALGPPCTSMGGCRQGDRRALGGSPPGLCGGSAVSQAGAGCILPWVRSQRSPLTRSGCPTALLGGLV